MSLMSWAAWDAVAVSDIGLPSGARRPFGRDLQLLDAIDVLPGEQFDFAVADLAPLGGATEMAVGRGRTENRIAQIECLDDARRREIEHLADGGLERFLRHRARAERVYHDGHRLGDADRIGDLHLAALGETRGDDVLCHPTHRVRRGAVHLGRILAAERAAAMPRHAAVAVDDDLASGQTGVTLRAADHETAGRIDQDVFLGDVEPGLAHYRPDDLAEDARPQ